MFAYAGSRLEKNQANMSQNPEFLRRFGQHWYAFSLVDSQVWAHIVAARHSVAAALPGRFLPELGRSSERPFFYLAVFCVVAASPLRSWALSPLRSRLLATPQNPCQLNRSPAAHVKHTT
jgi:hypothetical protein